MENTIFDQLRAGGKTVADLAQEAGLSRPTIYAAFGNGPEPTLATIRALSGVIGVPVEKMLTPEDRTAALAGYAARGQT